MSCHSYCSLTHDNHLLSICPPERLCPSNLSRVPLHLEILMTFGPAKSEAFRIVSDEHVSISGVDISRAEVTLFDTHLVLVSGLIA